MIHDREAAERLSRGWRSYSAPDCPYNREVDASNVAEAYLAKHPASDVLARLEQLEAENAQLTKSLQESETEQEYWRGKVAEMKERRLPRWDLPLEGTS